MDRLSGGKSNRHETLMSNAGLSRRNRELAASSASHKHGQTYCPICDRRTFDVSADKSGKIGIKMKCPNCNKFVVVYIKNPISKDK